jgi:hypothetical protein
VDQAVAGEVCVVEAMASEDVACLRPMDFETKKEQLAGQIRTANELEFFKQDA